MSLVDSQPVADGAIFVKIWGQKWTPEQMDQIIELTERGHTNREIGLIFGTTVNAVQNVIKRKFGAITRSEKAAMLYFDRRLENLRAAQARRSKDRWRSEVSNFAVEGRAKGLSFGQIARILNSKFNQEFSSSAVRHHVDRMAKEAQQ